MTKKRNPGGSDSKSSIYESLIASCVFFLFALGGEYAWSKWCPGEEPPDLIKAVAAGCATLILISFLTPRRKLNISLLVALIISGAGVSYVLWIKPSIWQEAAIYLSRTSHSHTLCTKATQGNAVATDDPKQAQVIPVAQSQETSSVSTHSTAHPDLSAEKKSQIPIYVYSSMDTQTDTSIVDTLKSLLRSQRFAIADKAEDSILSADVNFRGTDGPASDTSGTYSKETTTVHLSVTVFWTKDNTPLFEDRDIAGTSQVEVVENQERSAEYRAVTAIADRFNNEIH